MPSSHAASVGTHSTRSSYTTDAIRHNGASVATAAVTASNQPNYGGLNWTAFQLPTGDTGYTASQAGANYYYGPDQQLYLVPTPGQELPGAPSLGNVSQYFTTGLGATTNANGTPTTTPAGTTATDPITAAITALANSASMPDSSGGGSSDTGSTVVPTTTGGQPNILLPLLLLAAAGLAVWWYMRHHKKSAGSKP